MTSQLHSASSALASLQAPLRYRCLTAPVVRTNGAVAWPLAVTGAPDRLWEHPTVAQLSRQTWWRCWHSEVCAESWKRLGLWPMRVRRHLATRSCHLTAMHRHPRRRMCNDTRTRSAIVASDAEHGLFARLLMRADSCRGESGWQRFRPQPRLKCAACHPTPTRRRLPQLGQTSRFARSANGLKIRI